jgi:hypothetical protein
MKVINILLSFLIVAAVAASCGSKGKPAAKETVPAMKGCVDTSMAMGDGCAGCEMAGTGACDSASMKDGWVTLFDGKTTTGWRGYNSQTFPSKNWDISEGTIHCLGLGKSEMTNTDIITAKKYGNFELSLEWKISKGGNSGIFIMVQEIPKDSIYKSAPEMQVLDNENHPDGSLGVNGNHKAGSLYDLIPANPQNAKPFGEWNQVKIMVYQGKAVFNQNGVNVVEFTLGNDEWKKMVSNSKFKDWSWFVNVAKEGYIGLQDHGFEVWYRNIKIREL